VPYGDHFRLTLLPEAPLMREAFARIGRVLEAMVEDRRLRVA
jgi:alanine-synthesizing transaminase